MAGPKKTSSIRMTMITGEPFISDRTTDPMAAPTLPAPITRSANNGGDVDRVFVDLMLAHHRQGLTLAEDERERGAEPCALRGAGQMVDDLVAEMTALENARLTLDGWTAG